VKLPVAVVIVILAMGHVFSNMVRTLPALAADVLQRDLAIGPEALAQLTGVFPFAFAVAMLPVGVGLDRWGVRPTSLVLLLLGVLGSVLAALAPGTGVMLLGQVVLGFSCSGMMMCPLTFAARTMDAPRFALWSGITQAVGNSGMLLSASPLALLVDRQGWRAGYLACAGFALLVAALVALGVPRLPAKQDVQRPTLVQDARQVLALLVSPGLRPIMVLACASFAGQFGVRALWGGPWLMEVKGLSRVAAGNVLLVYTLTVIIGPVLNGWLARVWPRRVFLLAAGHGLAGLMLLALLAGADLPAWWDVLTLSIFGLTLCSQIIIFSLVRAAVPEEQTGRALSANNIAFFGGAAILQALSGVAAGFGGTAAALATFAVALLACTGGFLLLQPRTRR
jgi:predicted MFS family arabinose efflux permease